MAFSVTDRGTANGAAITSLVVASFTPGATRILFLWVSNSAGAITSIVGHGTWVLLEQELNYPIGESDFSLYGLITGGSPSAATVTVNFDSTMQASCGVIEVDGADVSGTISQAIGVTASATEYNGFSSDPHEVGVTLAAFASASNMTLIGSATRGTAAQTVSAKSGYTLANSTPANASGGIAYQTSEDSSPWVGHSIAFANFGAVGVEVLAAGGGGGSRGYNPGMSGGMLHLEGGMQG